MATAPSESIETGSGPRTRTPLPVDGTPAAELRREINRLVSRVSARTSQPHAVVHTQLRQSVPGPPSASASVDVLRARRERLRTML